MVYRAMLWLRNSRLRTDPSMVAWNTASTGVVRRRRNYAHIALLLLIMAGLLALCGWIVAAWRGILWGMLVGGFLLATIGRFPIDALLRGMRARPIWADEAPGLHAAFAELCDRAGLYPAPRLYHVDEPLPLAFSLGSGEGAAIVIADMLLDGLSRRELCAILAHEICHLRSGDMLLKRLGFTLAWVARLMREVGFLVVIIGVLLHVMSLAELPLLSLVTLALAPIGVNLLQLAMSRAREAEADLEAAELTGDPAGLASALVKLRRWQESRLRQLFPTGRILHLPSLFADHPPTEARIRQLRQMGGHG